MINLFKFEWRKLWQSKSLYIIFSIGFLSIIATLLVAKMVTDIFNVSANATAYILTAIPGSSIASLLGVYAAIYACTDFSQHTIKNVYARGYSRSAVYFTKYLVSLGVTMAVGIIYILFTFVFALMLGNYAGSIDSYMWGKLALQFWVLFGMHGLFFGISMMIGKMAGSLIVNIVGITLAFALINTIISIFATKFNFKFDLMNYHLEIMLKSLIDEKTLTTAELTRVIVMPIAYAVVAVTGGWLANQRRDV